MTARDLQTELQSTQPPTLLHVSPEEVFAAARLHLRTPDFFETDRHPTAEFAATAAERIPSCTDGIPNISCAVPSTSAGSATCWNSLS